MSWISCIDRRQYVDMEICKDDKVKNHLCVNLEIVSSFFKDNSLDIGLVGIQDSPCGWNL